MFTCMVKCIHCNELQIIEFPHSSTGVAPSSLMFGRRLKDKLPGLMLKGNSVLEEIRDRDHIKKTKEAEYADKRRMAKPDELTVGDTVVLKRVQKDNKLSTTFDPEEYMVIDRRGSDCTLQSKESTRIIHRNVSHVKKLFSATNNSMEQQEEPNISDTRDNELVLNSKPGSDADKLRPRRESKKPLYLKDFEISNVE